MHFRIKNTRKCLKLTYSTEMVNNLIRMNQVWLSILASCLTMGPILYVFINRIQPDRLGSFGLSIQRCYWFVYGALLKQGSSLEPRSGNTLIYRVLLKNHYTFKNLIYKPPLLFLKNSEYIFEKYILLRCYGEIFTTIGLQTSSG